MHAHQPRLSYRQALIAALGLVVALLVFVTTQRLCLPRFDLSSAADMRIPFVPASWYVYVLFYPFVIGTALLACPERFAMFMTAAVLAYAVALCCFLAFPELVPRPDVASIDDAFLRQRLARMWLIDRPTHGFPSLHVTFTLLAAWMLRGHRLGWAIAAIGAAISLSTLTVKQHTCADVAGGTLLALLSGAIAQRLAARSAR